MENTATKPHLTFKEACQYLGLSASYLYKLTHRNEISFYKPMGKLIYFLKSDLDEWLVRNGNESAEHEVQRAAENKAMHKTGGKH